MKKLFLFCFMAMMWLSVTAYADVPSDAVAFNGHYYKFFNIGCKWSEANAACQSMGGHLVTITSQKEQDFCVSLMGSITPKYCWMGAYHNSDGWHWVTGEKWDFEYWSYDQPNGSGGGDYALIDNGTDSGACHREQL